MAASKGQINAGNRLASSKMKWVNSKNNPLFKKTHLHP